MSSNRIYRKKLSCDEIISEFEHNLGTQFDPDIGKVFLEMLKNNYKNEDLEEL